MFIFFYYYTLCALLYVELINLWYSPLIFSFIEYKFPIKLLKVEKENKATIDNIISFDFLLISAEIMKRLHNNLLTKNTNMEVVTQKEVFFLLSTPNAEHIHLNSCCVLIF